VPYCLYRRHGSQYSFERKVCLAGRNNGIIFQAVNKIMKRSKFPWSLNNNQLLDAASVSSETHALLIYGTPGQDETKIFALNSIFGYTYETWTPVMFCVTLIHRGDPATHTGDSNGEFILRFVSEPEHGNIHTVQYLLGGYNGGTWNYGGRGPLSGAFLWPDAFLHMLDHGVECLR
jgi:hypothetical protein